MPYSQEDINSVKQPSIPGSDCVNLETAVYRTVRQTV